VLRTFLILLPLLSTLAALFLMQTRIRDLLSLRERGKQDIRTIIDYGLAEFAAVKDYEQRYTTIHRDLVEKMDKIDKEQSKGFFTIVPEIENHKNNS